MTYKFPVFKTENPKAKPDFSKLAFGRNFTDHMFTMSWSKEEGWHDGKIVPYGPLSLDPATAVLHYAQEMFEGMKAYRTAEGQVQLFRPDMNAKRTNKTNDRMCMPNIDEEMYVDAIKQLVEVDQDWVPNIPGTSLYIRPFMFADEVAIGVHPANHFKFVVIMCPVGAYYGSDARKLKATSIFVEDEYVRAVPGGTGFAKVGGNYAASLKSFEKASAHGCDQTLWLDAIERKYVEEIGTSNAFFVINGTVITAPLHGTILPGITRDSVLTLLRKWGIPTEERKLSMDELFEAAKDGSLDEVFATGTAAVISPVGRLVYKEHDLIIKDGGVGELAQKLYDNIYGLQTGAVADDMGWIVKVC
ncbi:MAG: branched-chain amino acid aminotransferase [Firmicutes bacterium]|nr:branched-chain amino acid aminotransferase [Bacillota bacterium]